MNEEGCDDGSVGELTPMQFEDAPSVAVQRGRGGWRKRGVFCSKRDLIFGFIQVITILGVLYLFVTRPDVKPLLQYALTYAYVHSKYCPSLSRNSRSSTADESPPPVSEKRIEESRPSRLDRGTDSYMYIDDHQTP